MCVLRLYIKREQLTWPWPMAMRCEKFTLPSLPYLTHALHLCTSFSMLQDDEYYLYAAKP